jgi:endonuclease/exonuclease/phosphatase family metal-dependent hydrolase
MEHLVLSFNLRVNVVVDLDNAWPFRLKSVVKYLKDNKPLVFGTQEGVIGMVEEIKKALPNYEYVGVSRSDDPINGEFSAIFYDKTRLKVRATETLWISETPYQVNTKSFNSALPRIITWAEFYFKDNNKMKFRFFNTHLDHMSEEARLEGVKMIRRLIDELNKKEVLPFIITGDFNATINDKPIQYLLKYDDMVYVNNLIKKDDYGTTFHEFKGTINGDPIDHIFVDKTTKVNKVVIFRDKINNKYVSDHYPLEAYIEFVNR